MIVLYRVFLAAACLLVMAGAALSDDDLMAGYYGNTLIIWRDSDATPNELHMWINPDHTFTTVNITRKDGHVLVRMGKGNWELQGNRFCRINNAVNPPTNSCTASTLNSGEPGHKVGDKWDNVTRAGLPEHFEVVAGQQ
jgi:hypothetical protein